MDHNRLLKILEGMGIPDHLTCLLRNLLLLQKPVLEKPSTTLRELENSGLLHRQAQKS